jgi:hypothetical protein
MTDDARRKAKNDLYRRLYGGTETGRIPSSTPARGNDPKPPGQPLLEHDFSSLELRVAAQYDRSTIAYFVDGPDPWDDWKPNRDIV